MNATPALCAWSGHLTTEGQAVADWLNLIGAELPRPPDRSLLKPAQLYLRNLSPEQSAELWARYQAAQEATHV